MTRGLEISSYAFALGRKANVEMGTLFDIPSFAWLDAHEEQTTSFYFSLQRVNGNGQAGGAADGKAAPLELVRQDSDGDNDLFTCSAQDAMKPIVLY